MFEWITRAIADFGYMGLFALMWLENVFPPLPSELIIPLAGFVAAGGEWQLLWVIVVASAGSLNGAWLSLHAISNTRRDGSTDTADTPFSWAGWFPVCGR